MDASPNVGFQSTVEKICGIFNRLSIRFHLTGGLTSVIYGDPRLTQDVDFVVDPERVQQIESTLLAALEEERLQISRGMASAAIRNGGMFQALDVEEVIKIDIYVRCLIPGELDRSVEIEIFPNLKLPVAAKQ